MTGEQSHYDLAKELRECAPNVEAFFDHKRAARLMRRAADVIDNLAQFDPDIEAERSET